MGGRNLRQAQYYYGIRKEESSGDGALFDTLESRKERFKVSFWAAGEELCPTKRTT